MIAEIKAPGPGESVSEVEIANWLVNDGDIVMKDQEIAELESEKASLPLIAGMTGKIHILKVAGERVRVGTVIGSIDTSFKAGAGKDIKPGSGDRGKNDDLSGEQVDAYSGERGNKAGEAEKNGSKVKITPLASKMMQENDLTMEDVLNGLRKITSHDIRKLKLPDHQGGPSGEAIPEGTGNEKRIRMSLLRKKLSERLVAVKNETAMLTTFNEADMSRVMAVREEYKNAFLKEHGIRLGFMSFFAKASAMALSDFPIVNSRIEGEYIVTPGFYDIGIAVQTDKGLMVPVIRNAGARDLAEIEKEIAVLAQKARDNRVSIEEMKGGTFTITNGGIFGSMMSTPILNPPQAAILGMG